VLGFESITDGVTYFEEGRGAGVGAEGGGAWGDEDTEEKWIASMQQPCKWEPNSLEDGMGEKYDIRRIKNNLETKFLCT